MLHGIVPYIAEFRSLYPDIQLELNSDDLIIDLLEQQLMLLSHGTGFNLATPDHLRMVFLAPVDVLDDATDRLARFLATYRQ